METPKSMIGSLNMVSAGVEKAISDRMDEVQAAKPGRPPHELADEIARRPAAQPAPVDVKVRFDADDPYAKGGVVGRPTHTGGPVAAPDKDRKPERPAGRAAIGKTKPAIWAFATDAEQHLDRITSRIEYIVGAVDHISQKREALARELSKMAAEEAALRRERDQLARLEITYRQLRDDARNIERGIGS